MALILKDGSGNILKQIELGEASKEEYWFLTRSQFSEIQYVHEYTKPAIPPRISVKHFLARGFPNKKDVVDAHFLSHWPQGKK